MMKLLQHHLLMKTTLTLKKALEIAQEIETASQNIHEMQGIPQVTPGLGQSSEGVHEVCHKKNEFVCYRCGQSDHGPAHCSFHSSSVTNGRC